MAAGRDESPLRPVRSFLTEPEGLADVIARAQHLARLEPRIKAVLPPTLAAHCALANVRGDTLVLSVTSTAVAARLRLLTPQILQAVIDLDISVTNIKIRVGYVTPPPAPPPPKRLLSATARKHLIELAGKIDDPEMREIIEAFVAGQGDDPSSL